MAYCIKLVCLANGDKSQYDGLYLRSYSPQDRYLDVTVDRDRAKRYQSTGDAVAEWRTSIGVRPDGKPDRPLTAWSISIESLDDLVGRPRNVL